MALGAQTAADIVSAANSRLTAYVPKVEHKAMHIPADFPDYDDLPSQLSKVAPRSTRGAGWRFAGSVMSGRPISYNWSDHTLLHLQTDAARRGLDNF